MSVRLTLCACGMGVMGAATLVVTAAGADVSFSRNGPFEVCLNGAYAAWLRHQAELLVNEDKRVRTLNDASVVAWTAATLDDCRKKGEATPAPSTASDATWRGGETMCSTKRKVFGGADSRIRPQVIQFIQLCRDRALAVDC